MDYEAIKAGLAKVVPMNTHLGLELLEVGDGRGAVRLPNDARMLNHVGSQHAAGLFAAGEFASGAAMTGALAAHLANATPLAAARASSRQNRPRPDSRHGHGAPLRRPPPIAGAAGHGRAVPSSPPRSR